MLPIKKLVKQAIRNSNKISTKTQLVYFLLDVCAGDSLLMYMDCKICVCPRPNRPRCFKKTCDLRSMTQNTYYKAIRST